MYYQNYEDYIRTILGYPISNTRQYNMGINTYTNDYMNIRPRYNSEILALYPDIYKILNPMVYKVCSKNTMPITGELLEQMTDEIYSNFEDSNTENNVTNIRVNFRNENNDTRTNNSNQRSRDNRRSDNDSINRNTSEKEEYTQNYLKDFIKTLILNELLYGNSRQRENYYFNHHNQLPRQIYYDDYINY